MTVLPPIEAAEKAKDYSEFISLITEDRFVPACRNPLADEWRQLYIKPVSDLGPAPGDIFADENRARFHLKMDKGWSEEEIEALSVYEMFIALYGREYADAYKAMMHMNLYKYLRMRYDELRTACGKSTYMQDLVAYYKTQSVERQQRWLALLSEESRQEFEEALHESASNS